MRERARTLGASYDRIVRARARIHWLHGAAFLAVAFSFLIEHVIGRAWCIKSCGIIEIVESSIIWWPVLLSWLLLRRLEAVSVFFRVWQPIFVCLNLGVCLVYVVSPWGKIGSYLLFSVAHGAALMLMALAVRAARPIPDASRGD